MAGRHKYQKSKPSGQISPLNNDEICPTDGSSSGSFIPVQPARPSLERSKNEKPELNGYKWTGHTILIVEDNYISFRLLQHLLNKSMVNILHADDGLKAIDMVNEHPEINLVLMDIKLPVINGFEATIEIKKIRPDLPVIAQTANAMEDDRLRCLDSGCVDYITKPIVFDTLFKMINKYIQGIN